MFVTLGSIEDGIENQRLIYLYKAKIQQELGDIAGAMESSKTSLALSKMAKNDDYVRMNEKLQKELKRNR